MKPETRDTLNLGATIVTAIVAVIAAITIPLAAGYFNTKIENVTQRIDLATEQMTSHSDSNVSALKQAITETYETQAAHKTDMDVLTAQSRNLWQGQRDLADKVDKNNVEQRLSIQHLGDLIQNSTKTTTTTTTKNEARM